jgi:hypothetical protein
MINNNGAKPQEAARLFCTKNPQQRRVNKESFSMSNNNIKLLNNKDNTLFGLQINSLDEAIEYAVPDQLREYNQWIVWQFQPNKDTSKKPLKVPMKLAGNQLVKGGVNDAGSFMSFDDALKAYQDNMQSLSGIGFVFTEDDPFIGLDFDDCFNGECLTWAKSVIDGLDTYIE